MLAIPSLRRRTALVLKPGKRVQYLDLPDDILILIFSQCRIDELFALRLTHSRARDLTSEYITTIAPSVARSTLPHSELLLRPLDDPTQYTFGWLKRLIPQQLAAILVDRHRIAADEWTQSRWGMGIPAEDSFGDDLRARVANGWHILRNLCRISREVTITDMPHSRANIANKILRPSRFVLDTLLQREQLILDSRLEYIKTLSEQHAKDYKVLIALLSAAFSASIANVGSDYEPWIFDWGDGLDGPREFRKGQSWLAWFVLAQGPDMFWKQWWSLPHTSSQNYIRDLALFAFRQTPKTVADHQRRLAWTLQQAVNKKADVEADFNGSNPFRYFKEYARYQKQRGPDGIPPVRDIMERVPFRVNFRCPEALLQRTAFLLETPTTSGAQSSRQM